MTPPDTVLMPFGKYKGKEVKLLPANYLRWASEQSLPDEVKAAVLHAIRYRGIKTNGPIPELGEAPWNQSDPADQVEEPSRRDERREQYNDAPRGSFRISPKGGYVKVNGTIIRTDEIRSIRPVRTPVQKDGYKLSHVMTVKLGCLGEGSQSPTKVWLTEAEAAEIEGEFFKS